MPASKFVVVINPNNGRVKRVVIADTDAELAAHLPREGIPGRIALPIEDYRGDIQELVTTRFFNSIVPDDHHVAIDKNGLVKWVGPYDPLDNDPYNDPLIHYGLVSLEKHPTAGPGWTKVGADFVAPVVTDIPSPKQAADRAALFLRLGITIDPLTSLPFVTAV